MREAGSLVPDLVTGVFRIGATALSFFRTTFISCGNELRY